MDRKWDVKSGGLVGCESIQSQARIPSRCGRKGKYRCKLDYSGDVHLVLFLVCAQLFPSLVTHQILVGIIGIQ